MRIAILMSGGDAPGMNAVVFGAFQEAAARSSALIGVRRGFRGLLDGEAAVLGFDDLPSEIAGRSGTLLGTSRDVDLRDAEQQERCLAAIGTLGVDGLVVAGGAGSRAAVDLLRPRSPVPFAFIPATIDNDVADSEETIGFDSAVNYGVRELDALRASADALRGRSFIVEVLGGNCGRLAEAIHAASPVAVVLTPERSLDLETAAAALRAATQQRYGIALMTEGCGEAACVGRRLSELMGGRVRPTVLGHGQRGAAPSARDRTLGLASGRLAVAALHDGRGVDVTIVGGRPLATTPSRGA
jgi:6-phosphofructokinase 1